MKTKARKYTSKAKKTSTPNRAKISRKPKIDDYNKSKPMQMELFELMNPSEQDYSNTVELYDFIPKYVWGRVERIQEKFLEPIEREFDCRRELKIRTEYRAIIFRESARN
jgi:hypothetical protein